MRISDWSSDVCSSDLTYAAQRDLIKRRLVASGLDTLIRDACKVDTVDSYQGKENPIVILSLVRNNADGALEHGTATIQPGFMQRPNRINVAISRAMEIGRASCRERVCQYV